MEVDSVGIIAILGISFITTCIVKTWTSVAKIPRVPVENQITTLSVVKIAIKFSPCSILVLKKKKYAYKEQRTGNILPKNLKCFTFQFLRKLHLQLYTTTCLFSILFIVYIFAWFDYSLTMNYFRQYYNLYDSQNIPYFSVDLIIKYRPPLREYY